MGQVERETKGSEKLFRYECPPCHSVWCRYEKARLTMLTFCPTGEVEVRRVRRSDLQLLEAESSAKCTRCGKAISLLGTFGSWGESEAEGLLLNGAAYCWNCAEKTAEIEQSVRPLER